MNIKPICLDKPDISELGYCYYPDDCEDVYMSQILVEELISKLEIMKYDVEKPVINIIKKHEFIHAQKVLGEISTETEKNLVDELYENYRDRFHKWPQDEKEYRQFYRLINKVDIL